MRLVLREALSEPSGRINEDFYGAAENAAWLLDGATGVAESPVLPGPSDARWLVERIDAALRRHVARREAPATLLADALREVADAFRAEALRPAAPRAEMPCASFLMLRLSGGALEACNLGDCRLIRAPVGGAVQGFGASRLRALDAALLAEATRLRDSGVAQQAIWPRMVPLIRAHRALMNRPEGYWILEASGAGLAALEVARFAAVPGERLLLMSDGFYRLVDTYGRHDEAGLLAAAVRRGLGALRGELRAIEREDPECRRYPRLKPADDATALLLEVTS
jgi:hypothetical protein